MAATSNRIEGKSSIAPEILDELPIPILGKTYPSYALTDCCVRFPTLLLALFLFFPLVLTILSLNFESTLDTRPGTFSISDHSTAQRQYTIDNAVETWEGELDKWYANARNFRITSDRSEVYTRIFISYEVDAAAATNFIFQFGLENQSAIDINRRLNLLDQNNIEYIRDFELGLMRLQKYEKFCYSSRFRGGPSDSNTGLEFPRCSPPNSAMTWFYPGVLLNSSIHGSYWSFDMTTGLQTPINKVSDLFYQSSSYRWFVDQSASPTNQQTFLLRSQFQLGVPLSGFAPGSPPPEQEIDEFIVEVTEYLQNPPAHPFIRINFGGDRIEQALASTLADGDTTRVFMCLLILFPVLWYYFHSFVLAVLSVLQLAITYPAGFYIFISARGGDDTKLSLLTALSYLVTLVMAANGMMIIFDTFRQSGFMPTTGRRNLLTVGQRLAYTYRKAGTGITVATIITVACFLANLSSKVPAVKSFCGMAAVFVIFNWFMLMTYFPSAMLFHHFHISRRRRNLQKQKEVLLERGLRVRDPTFARFNADVELLNERHMSPTFNHLQNSANIAETIRKRDRNQGAGGLFGGGGVRNANGDNLDEAHDPQNQSGAGVEGGLFQDTSGVHYHGDNNGNNNNDNQKPFSETVVESVDGFFKALGVTDVAKFFQCTEAEQQQGSKQRKNYNPDNVGSAPNIQLVGKRMVVSADGTTKTQQNDQVLLPQSTAFEVDEEQFLNLFSDAPPSADADGEQDNNNNNNNDNRAGHVSLRYKAMWQTALLPDAMRLSLNDVVEIRFINCDEMLAFDDTNLRERLIQLGHSDFANFIYEETDDVAPLCGIVPQFRKQVLQERIHTMVGVALPLLYGKGRTLMSLNLEQLRVAQKSKKKSKEDRVNPNNNNNQQNNVNNNNNNNNENDKDNIYADNNQVVETRDENGQKTTMRRKAPPKEGDDDGSGNDDQEMSNKDSRYATNSNQQNQQAPAPPPPPPPATQQPGQHSVKTTVTPPGTRPRAQNPLRQMLAKANMWWRGRTEAQREYCCGYIGKRIDETPEERQRRILAKTIKHEGYTFWERVFYNEVSDIYNGLRFLGILALLIALIVCAIFSSDLPFSSKPPEFLGIRPTERYDVIKSVFGESGNCDYCSAYFQPLGAFPRPSSAAVAACTGIFSAPRYFLELDLCGSCGSDNSCLDCQGVPSGAHRTDTCTQCTLPTNELYNKCAFCINSESMKCSYCSQTGGGTDKAGPTCGTTCNVENCRNGVCNPFTGFCDCFKDSTNGYWASSPSSGGAQCTVCESGWAGPKCNLDCARTAGDCTCAFGRCLGCPWGLAGENCAQRRDDLCSITGGTPDATTSSCTCNSGYSGTTCHGLTQCTGHGVVYTATEAHPAVADQCACFGQWRGPKCDFCRCYNGGTCDEFGKCSCKSGWGGDRCQECASACKTRGFCTEPYNVSQYDYRTCRALFCTDAELTSDTNTTADCQLCWYYSRNPECDNSGGTCLAAENCIVSGNNDNGTSIGCRKNFQPDQSLNHDCHCRGNWYSDSCSVCNTSAANNARGIYCRESDGVLLGCDGNPQSSGSWTTLDSCNTCGGVASRSVCSGCDGIIGSDKVVDQCGVCGGYNDCLAGQLQGTTASGSTLYGSSSVSTLVQPQSLVKISFGLKLDEDESDQVTLDLRFDFAQSSAQSRLKWICDQLFQETAIVRPTQTRCFVNDFRNWLIGQNLPFPYTANDIHQKAYQFALENGRFGEIAFNQLNGNATDLRATWLLIEIRPVRLYDTDPQEYLQEQYEIWKSVERNINAAGTETLGATYVSSSAFVALFSLRAAKLGTIFTTVLGCGLFVLLILTVTCSVLLSFCSLLVLVTNILFVLAMFRATGWDMGPIEQVSIALLLGVVSERAVHICESYMEYLQRIHSHWFAQEATRLQAVKNMMQRVGVSLTCSSITLVIGTCIALSANLFVIRRIAVVVLIIISSQIIFSLILLPMLLLAVGPVTNTVNLRLMAFFFLVGVIVFILIFVPAAATGAIALI